MEPSKKESLIYFIKRIVEYFYKEELWIKQNKKWGQGKRKNIRPHILYYRGYEITGWKWILNRTLREVSIKRCKIHVSVQANKLWKKFFEGDIKDYMFTDSVKVKKSGKLPMYKANSNTPTWKYLKKGQIVNFNTIFHDEHIVPIGRIVMNLYNLCEKGKLTDKNIYKELNKIHMVKMLKKEDRNLSKTMKKSGIKDSIRADNWKIERDTLYKKAGIRLLK